jgi:hypothetical protein
MTSLQVTSGSHVTSGHAQWYILYYYYRKKKLSLPVTYFTSRMHNGLIPPEIWLEPYWYTTYVVHTEYFYFFSSTEHCAWAIISPKEFRSWVKSPLGLVLYCYLNMPTINKTYLILSYLIFGSRAYPLHYCTGKQNYLLSNILRLALKICIWAQF